MSENSVKHSDDTIDLVVDCDDFAVMGRVINRPHHPGDVVLVIDDRFPGLGEVVCRVVSHDDHPSRGRWDGRWVVHMPEHGRHVFHGYHLLRAFVDSSSYAADSMYVYQHVDELGFGFTCDVDPNDGHVIHVRVLYGEWVLFPSQPQIRQIQEWLNGKISLKIYHD